MSLQVCEIFFSIQGEGTRSGLPCAFVRLSGCNLRCRWCDTRYAQEPGHDESIEQILRHLSAFRARRVDVTGGEPLLQDDTLPLLKALCDDGYETLLQTNGSLDILPVDRRVVRLVDFKCPSSGFSAHNRWDNVNALTPRDEVKFVVATAEDYGFARRALQTHRLLDRCPVTSPRAGTSTKMWKWFDMTAYVSTFTPEKASACRNIFRKISFSPSSSLKFRSTIRLTTW